MRRDNTFKSSPGMSGIILHVGSYEPLKEKGEKLEEQVSSPLEDLMKEHGLVERIVLIYDRMIENVAAGQAIDLSIINRTATIARDVIENHHERNEEQYIFPKFKEANYIVDIVDTLKDQHDRARAITKDIIDISSRGRGADMESLRRMINLCGAYAYMYLPHISRENTILYPTFYDIVSARYVKEIREKMEDDEKKLLGKTGFRGLVGRLSEIEKAAGTFNLSQYTARDA